MGWLAAQTGSRERYAVPRGLATAGQLDLFYTDAWCRVPSRLVRRLPGRLDRYGNRRAPGIRPVQSFEVPLAAAQVVDRLCPTTRRQRADDEKLMRLGVRFSSLVRKDLERRQLDPRHHAFFTHSFCAMESITHLRHRGVPTVVSQLDPMYSDMKELSVECERWPDWEGFSPVLRQDYIDRLAQRLNCEWSAASVVVVHSNWSRRSVIAQGCQPDKVAVIPHAYEPLPSVQVVDRTVTATGRRLRVLWLGQVVLRKGIPYLMDAARQLPDVDFIVAGRIAVDEGALRRAARPNVSILGPVSETEACGLRAAADVFVLPTVSDGFAVTQLEAMAAGLPVIATRNCGEVVTDGRDGFVVPARDAAALAAAISKLDGDRELLAEFSRQARRTSTQFSLERYVEELRRVLGVVAPHSMLGVAAR